VDVPEGTHGAATVKRFTVGPHDLSNLRYSMRGRGTKPGEYTMLLVNQNLWMSDTDAEVRDHFEAIHQIRLRGGHILINGLGLGVVVKAALACDNVDLVTVVERDPDVIALVAPHYAVDPRFRIVQADAFTVQWYPKSHWTVAWHDIWLHLSLDNLPEMHRLHRKYGTRVDWQGSWSRNWIEHQRRTGRVLG
jgi:hypothetical protein